MDCENVAVSPHSSGMRTESRILYMDEHLAVFNKAAGDICETIDSGASAVKNGAFAEDGGDGTVLKHSVCESCCLPDVFTAYLKKSAPDVLPPSFVHCFNRLDRPVSGAVLLVFNRALIPLLQNQFTAQQKEDGGIKKLYWAVLEGRIPPKTDCMLLEHYIRFDAKRQKSFVYDKAGRKTKKARLLWRPVFCTDRYTFAEIRLLSGRTHQIRAQLAHTGYHIKGDVKYGSRRADNLGGIRLHAAQLRFMHPVTKRVIDVRAPLLKLDALWNACIHSDAEQAEEYGKS